LRPFSSVLRAAQKSNMRASATSCSRPITHKTLCAAEMEWHRSCSTSTQPGKARLSLFHQERRAC
jgi:hypothetical protein